MDLKNLYRQVIMEHYKSPRNKGLVNDENYFKVEFDNPSCGDEIIVQLDVKNNIIKDIRHDGKGCSICCSSASVMSETLINKDVESAKKTLNEFYELLKGMPYDESILDGDVLAYQGIKDFPARVKCASLAWKALEKGLGDNCEQEKNK